MRNKLDGKIPFVICEDFLKWNFLAPNEVWYNIPWMRVVLLVRGERRPLISMDLHSKNTMELHMVAPLGKALLLGHYILGLDIHLELRGRV
jgi:hypothetical protein